LFGEKAEQCPVVGIGGLPQVGIGQKNGSHGRHYRVAPRSSQPGDSR
jgi:hypothetical protein